MATVVDCGSPISEYHAREACESRAKLLLDQHSACGSYGSDGHTSALSAAAATMVAVGTLLAQRQDSPRALLLCVDETDGRTLAAVLAAHIAGAAVVNVCVSPADDMTPKPMARVRSCMCMCACACACARACGHVVVVGWGGGQRQNITHEVRLRYYHHHRLVESPPTPTPTPALLLATCYFLLATSASYLLLATSYLPLPKILLSNCCFLLATRMSLEYLTCLWSIWSI